MKKNHERKPLIKKVVFLILLSMVLLCIPMSVNALELTSNGQTWIYNGPEVKLILKDKEFKVSANQMPPIIYENRTLVPVREVFETLGGKVEWIADLREININYNGQTIKMKVDDQNVNVNGQNKVIDVPVKIINSKTMVPVRFISENIGLKVDWNAEQKTVSISEQNINIEVESIVQKSGIRDYTFSWWPNGVGKSYNNPFYVQTGYYGFGINSVDGTMTNIGPISKEYTQDEVLGQKNDVISTLPKLTTSYFVTNNINGKSYEYAREVEQVLDNTAITRIIESGQYMQSFDVIGMKFKNSEGITNEFLGRVEYKALPEYVAINFDLYAEKEMNNLGVAYAISFGEKMNGEIDASKKKIKLKGNGKEFILYTPNDNAFIEYNSESGSLRVNNTINAVANKYNTGVSIIVIPVSNSDNKTIEKIEGISNLKFEAKQISNNNAILKKGSIVNNNSIKKGEVVETYYDKTHGVWVVNTNNMTMLRDSYLEKNKNAYDGVEFTITNYSNYDIKVPIMFLKEGEFAKEGFAPVLRDSNTKEPIGIPIQISKNWHEYNNWEAGLKEWHKYLQGTWFHGYTYLEIPAGKAVSYEYLNAFQQWGTVKLAHHSQLSLIGWRDSNRPTSLQVWNSSSLGSLGEAFCYDPDKTNGYDFIGDVRGTGFDPYGRSGANRYIGWGSNNGGGNFLHYGKNGTNSYGSNEITDLKNVKVFYKNYGPNLTEVIYKGITEDNAVEITYTTYLPRTNDVTRATHSFEYRFLKDVSYERMAFYQIGGDNHNSGRWNNITVGNDYGPISFNLDGKSYAENANIPISNIPGYIGGNGMQQINVPGNGLWIAFTDSVKGVSSDADTEYERQNMLVANRMLNLLDYEAKINGKNYSKPAVSFRSTKMFGDDSKASILAELGPTKEVGNTIKAGSIIKGTVEYINLPNTKESYYFDSKIINAIDSSDFNTWRLAYLYAKGGKSSVTASKGKIESQYPIKVSCVKNDILAQIEVTGGISYIPITFKNLSSYSGYKLQVLHDSTWEDVEQSVIGNDFWQTYYDASSGTYEITYNVEHTGNPVQKYQYRLINSDKNVSNKEKVNANDKYEYGSEERIAAFWENDTMYNETVTMIRRDNGEITAKLLFVPDKIIKVKDAYMNPNYEYIEGIDFEWIEGTNELRWINSSNLYEIESNGTNKIMYRTSIPYFENGDLSATGVNVSLGQGVDYLGRAKVGAGNYTSLWCDSAFFYDKQISVTYEYDIKQVDKNGIAYTGSQKSKLKNTLKKLEENKDLKVLVYGDSILKGYNASSLYNRSPYMPAMDQLIKEELQNHTKGKVTLDNISVAGFTVEDGLKALKGQHSQYNYSNAYKGNYDLMILSFGMNDNNLSKENYEKYLNEIITNVKSANPNIEIILVACMIPNPRAIGFIGEIEHQGEIIKNIAKTKDYIAAVDMFEVHKSILEYKDYSSTTGDNLRHPNDWFIRVYAQNILATMFGKKASILDEKIDQVKKYKYTEEERIIPFWENDVMYNEPAPFIERENGEIIAKLLFVPERIIKVQDAYLNPNYEYVEGVDFEWIEGTNKLKLLNKSIPYFRKGDLEAEGVSNPIGTKDSYGRAKVGNSACLWCDAPFFYDKQIAVTYEYDVAQVEDNNIKYTSYQGNALKNTIAKLKNNNNLNVLMYGDNILQGYNASSIYNRSPYMPTMAELIRNELQNNTKGKVSVDNLSVAGLNVEDGLKALNGTHSQYNYSNSYRGNYDLMILSFGINDNWLLDKEAYKNNIKAIIDKVKNANPNVEIILVSCMRPNPNAEGYTGGIVNHGKAIKEIAKETKYKDYVAVVDMFEIHDSILKYKDYSSTTGDNLKHPNDWFIRVYAQNILSTILK